MKKLSYIIVLVLILGLALTGCTLLSNVGQVPTTGQSGIAYLTKSGPAPDPSLVALWHFDEGSEATTVADSSGNDNTGDIYDATPGEVGQFGNALSFDGDDYVRVLESSSLIGITSVITVEAWIKFSNVSDAFYVRTPFNLDPKAWGLDRYGGKLRFYIYDGTTPIICEKAWTPEVNQWYNIAATYDGNILKLYVDKNLFQSLEYTGAINSTGQGVVMGARHSDGGWGYLRGFLDDVRIWNVVLAQDQLGKVYDFDGFFRPIDIDNDVFNVVKAGRAIPVKFSLNGDQGLEIFDDYPKSIQISCPGTSDSVDEMEFTEIADESSLNYDAFDDQYIFVWKTNKAWAGDCRQLEVKLNDGTSHFAKFTFK